MKDECKQPAGQDGELAALREEVARLRSAEEGLRLERDISLAQASATTLPDAMKQTLDLLVSLDGIDCGGIYRISPGAGTVDLVANEGLSQAFIDYCRQFGPGSPQHCIALGDTAAYYGETDFDDATRTLQRAEGIRSLAVVPIRHEDSCLGCLKLASKTWWDFPQSTRHVLESAASHLGACVAQREAQEALREAQADLERRVELRTRELEAMNHSLEAEVARHRRTMSKLEEAEASFRSTFETAADAIFWADPDSGVILNCNPAAEALMEQPREALIGQSQDRLHPPEKTDLYREMFTVHARQLGSTSDDAEIVTPTGRRKHVSIMASSIMVGGRPLVQGVFHDVTALREAELARNQLFTAMEQAAESMMVTDPAGIIQYVNPAFERITGYGGDEVLGRKPNVLRSGKHGDAVYRDLWATITRGRVWHGHLVNRCKNGDLIEEEVAISPVFDDAGSIVNYVALKHNVTERMSLERQLRHAQRMEAIGTLAGGIAHDFRNILSLIIGYGEIGLGLVGEEHPARSSLMNILKAGTRATEIVQQILTFSRRAEQDIRPLQPHVVVNEVLQLLKASLPSTIKIEHHISEECGSVMADPSQLHQVTMNLCTNAFQAMANRHGTLRITLDEEVVSAQRALEVGTLFPGRYVRLTVADTGMGMSNEVARRVFDPFFTTKGQGEGTGLGLATVHGVVVGAGGAIALTSELGEGTTFDVYLPQIAGPSEIPPTDNEVAQGAGQHILVVDDDADVLDLHRKLLELLGYRATTRINALDALDILRQRPGEFEAVLTDQIMPDMTGLELSHELKSAWPDLPVILVSGFPEDFAARPDASELSGVLAKPVTPHSLSIALRDAIAARPD